MVRLYVKLSIILLLTLLLSMLLIMALSWIPLANDEAPLPDVQKIKDIKANLEEIRTQINYLANQQIQEEQPDIYRKIVPEELHYIIPVVLEESEKNNLDPLYVLSVIQKESNFDPGTISKTQDMGLMQININTLPYLAGILGYPATEQTVLDPVKNIRMGCYYLGKHHDRFGDLYLTATAYNAGERAALSGRNAYSLSVMAQYRQYQAKGEILSAD